MGKDGNLHGLNGWDGLKRIFFFGGSSENLTRRRGGRGDGYGLTGWVRMERDG